LRAAARLAVAIAIEGEQADPRVPSPPALRPVLGFSRLSSAAYGVIHRVVDEDGVFRARVAAAADEEVIGRAGWLWLHRPVDWADDAVFSGEATPEASLLAAGGGGGDRAKDPAAKHRRAAEKAEASRKRVADDLAVARRKEQALRTANEELAARVSQLEAERSAAMRTAKANEASLASARGDLKVARAATRQAEAELAELRTRTAFDDPSDQVGPGVADEVRAAAVVAAELSAALGRVAKELQVTGEPAPAPLGSRSNDPVGQRPNAARRTKAPKRPSPALPPGIFGATPQAHRHLITDAANLVVVDGYNVARAAWSDAAPEEERRRTVALLDDVQARSGGSVIVVFDGDSSVTSSVASKTVRVRYSASGQTADAAISALIAEVPGGRPIVVVSSDREVAADARRQGAGTIGARDFLVAAGR